MWIHEYILFLKIKPFEICQPEEICMAPKFLKGSKFFFKKKSLMGSYGSYFRFSSIPRVTSQKCVVFHDYNHLSLLEHSYTRLFPYCLLLLSWYNSKDHRPPRLKYLLSSSLIFSQINILNVAIFFFQLLPPEWKVRKYYKRAYICKELFLQQWAVKRM